MERLTYRIERSDLHCSTARHGQTSDRDQKQHLRSNTQIWPAYHGEIIFLWIQPKARLLAFPMFGCHWLLPEEPSPTTSTWRQRVLAPLSRMAIFSCGSASSLNPPRSAASLPSLNCARCAILSYSINPDLRPQISSITISNYWVTSITEKNVAQSSTKIPPRATSHQQTIIKSLNPIVVVSGCSSGEGERSCVWSSSTS